MLSLLRETWPLVQAELRVRAGNAAYDAWLSELRPVLMERSVVYLEARGALVADRVQALFRPMLQELLSREIGTEVQVDVRPAPQAAQVDELEVGPQSPVIDESNKTAFLVLKSLLEGRPLGNLFLFHGAPGVGKTFLLRWWQGLHRGRVRAFELPGLTKAFQAVHLEHRVHHLREELCSKGPLLIDELHRIAGKEKLQQFLADVLVERDRLQLPTLLASRFHPREIWHLDQRLESVLLSGFVSVLERPGPMGRLRYLRALEGAPSRNGRRDEVESLAERLHGSWPELRTAWLEAKNGRPPSRYLELADARKRFLRLRDRIATHFAVTTDSLMGPKQSRNLSLARKVLAWLCVQDGLSRAEVGRFLSQRSRSAVSYMTRSLEEEMKSSETVRSMVEGLL